MIAHTADKSIIFAISSEKQAKLPGLIGRTEAKGAQRRGIKKLAQACLDAGISIITLIASPIKMGFGL